MCFHTEDPDVRLHSVRHRKSTHSSSCATQSFVDDADSSRRPQSRYTDLCWNYFANENVCYI